MKFVIRQKKAISFLKGNNEKIKREYFCYRGSSAFRKSMREYGYIAAKSGFEKGLLWHEIL